MAHLTGYEGIKLLGARVAIEIEKEENKTASGLLIVSAHEEPKFEGKVVAVGPGVILNNGERIPVEVQLGNHVLYSRMAGVPIQYNDKNILIINEGDIIAIFNN